MAQHDDDLKDRFRAMADEDASAAPEFSRARIEAQFRAEHGRRAWSSARNLAVAGASVVAALAVLTIGLVLGANTGYASARVEGERERDAMAASATGIRNQLAGLRIALARARTELTQPGARNEAIAHASLVAAESELQGMEASVKRIEVDLTQNREAVAPAQPTSIPGMPMKRALAITCGALALGAPASPAQQDVRAVVDRVTTIMDHLKQGIPVVNLPPATARATQTLGGILGIHQVADGKVLVDDAVRRQLKLFDSTLVSATVVMDSAAGASSSYGSRPTPLIPYVGDSSLFADWNAKTMLVLDGRGQIARALALPSQRDLWPLNSSYAGTDNTGRLIIRGPRLGMPHTRTPDLAYRDSLPLLRLDFDLRRVDTISQVARPFMKVVTQKSSEGQTHRLYALDPLQNVDDWAVLSNGSIAVVRGQDYHIDWIHPDGSTSSTPKLPFDWKRLTDDDKARLVDSVRAAQNALLAIGYPNAEIALRSPCSPRPEGSGGEGRGGRSGGGDMAAAAASPDCTMFDPNWTPAIGGPNSLAPRPPLLDVFRAGPVFDYLPVIRVSSTIADADGNLWILPRTSALSQKGELVYDVVNANGQLFERVRIPLGRAIVGFGKGGAVYLTSGDLMNGFYLERSRLPNQKMPPK